VTTGTKPISLGPLCCLLYTLRWDQPCRVSQIAVYSAHLLVSDESLAPLLRHRARQWQREIEQQQEVSGAMAYGAASSEGAPCSSQLRNTADVCARRQSDRTSSAIARIDPLGSSWVRQCSSSHPS
jgi:hypothetical protein